MLEALGNLGFLRLCGQAIYLSSAVTPTRLTAVVWIPATETNAGTTANELHTAAEAGPFLSTN
jgi:hypothetical protein